MHLRATVIAALLTVSTAALADSPPSTLATLVDRAQIEDLLVDYYAQLGGADRDLGSYYLEDGVLDVNGIVSRGRGPIEDLYKRLTQQAPRQPGRFHMLLTNCKIVVNGATATADLIWTGVRSANPKATPQFVEQGREHDELVKRGGRWLFKYRVITSDGGLPPMFEKSYKER